MNRDVKDLLTYLERQEHTSFSVQKSLDQRRYLPRDFPEDFPLRLQLHEYPNYQKLVGEQWLHWHDYYELILIVSGKGVFQCGTQRFAFQAGDVLVVDPLKLHGVWEVTETHTALCVFFHANAVAPTGSLVDQGFLAGFDARAEGAEPYIPRTEAHPLHPAMLRLSQAWFEHPANNERAVALKFHFLEVLFQLRHRFGSADRPVEQLHMRVMREEKLHRVLDHISQNCTSTLSQPEVAKIAGMSISRFRAFFKETTGWGFADYVLDVRIERAARMLRETEESIAAIAHAMGFSDQSHLQRAFKTRHGLSPLAYRKSHWAEKSVSESCKIMSAAFNP